MLLEQLKLDELLGTIAQLARLRGWKSTDRAKCLASSHILVILSIVARKSSSLRSGLDLRATTTATLRRQVFFQSVDRLVRGGEA